jgi:cytochrome c biogenesis protein CcmG, thiol:disulfide interchange protein DsbE
MKLKFFSFLLPAVFAGLFALAQEKARSLPSVDVKNLKGEIINTKTLDNSGKPIVLSFWATWCKPCVQELTAIAENYEEWQKETGMKLVAVSTDDARNSSRVGPFINARNWDFEVLLDPNGDLKRALNVNDIPHTFLLDSTKSLIWQHVSYTPGDEEKLYHLVQKVAKGETVTE